VNRAHFSTDELRPFRDAILKPGAARAMVDWYRAMPAQLLRPPHMPRFDGEALLVWGMADAALGYDDLVPGTERYAPKLRIVRIKGAGHFVQSEAPSAVNEALLDFLSQ
jgi:pimeloyl-ACP methyl ester carboxylesterase